MANSFNLICDHQRYCHPYCFERVLRQCDRLCISVRRVLGDKLPFDEQIDRRKVLISSWHESQDNKRKVGHKARISYSICYFQTFHRASSHVPRRESAIVRQGGLIEKPPMALKALLIEKLNEADELKDAKPAR